MTNGQVAVYAKDDMTTPRSLRNASEFFDASTYDLAGNGRITYDPSSGLWFSSIINAVGGVRVAVSTTSDPAGRFVSMVVNDGNDSDFSDQPKIAVSLDKVVLTAPGTTHLNVLVLQKSDLTAFARGQLAADAVRVARLQVGCDVFGCDSLAVPENSMSNTAWVVRTINVEGRQGFGRDGVAIASVTGTPAGGDVSASETRLDLATGLGAIPDPPFDVPWIDQPGTSDKVTGNDGAVESAVLQNGRLWMAMTETCVPAGEITSRACSRLIEADVTDAPSIVRDVTVSEPGTNVFDPAIGVTGDGTAVIDATIGGPTMYLSDAVGVLPPGADTVQLKVVRAGHGPDTDDLSGGDTEAGDPIVRWGDYAAAASDPTDPATVWTTGQHTGTDNRWATDITRVQPQPASVPDPPLAAPEVTITPSNPPAPAAPVTTITAPPAVPSQQPVPTLDWRVSRRTVTYGRSVIVTGNLAAPDGPVVVQERVAGRATALLLDRAQLRNGHLSVSIRPSLSGRLLLTYDGALSPRTVVLAVAPRLTLSHHTVSGQMRLSLVVVPATGLSPAALRRAATTRSHPSCAADGVSVQLSRPHPIAGIVAASSTATITYLANDCAPRRMRLPSTPTSAVATATLSAR